MAKFNVILERVETIVKQGVVMVEAGSAEEARQIILADLEIDAGSYDDHLGAKGSGSCLGPLFAAMMVDCNHPVGQIVDSSVG